MPRPFIPVENALKVEMRYILYGQKCENVFYVDRGSQAIEVAMDALFPIVKTWWSTLVKPHISDFCSLSEVKITDMSAGDGPATTYTAGLPIAGTFMAGALPGNVTVAVKLNSTYRGRNSTGRQFLVGLPPDAVVADQIEPVYQGAIKAAYEALLAALTGGDFGMIVVSFVIDKVLRTVGLKSPVASITIDNNLDSQRRRLAGRGQ